MSTWVHAIKQGKKGWGVNHWCHLKIQNPVRRIAQPVLTRGLATQSSVCCEKEWVFFFLESYDDFFRPHFPYALPLVSCAQQALKNRLAELIPIKAKEIKDFKEKHANTVIGNVTVDQVRPLCG